MRVVLDTNIIISAYLVLRGAPARILEAFRRRNFQLILSPALLAEYERVLTRPDVQRRHGASAEEIASDLAAIRSLATVVNPTEVPAVIAADPNDDMVLACALAGKADYIVSGDPHLLDLGEYEGIRIVSPAAFVSILGDA
jgi:putative PIN family toxin of toxin-antitoxin system